MAKKTLEQLNKAVDDLQAQLADESETPAPKGLEKRVKALEAFQARVEQKFNV